MRTLLRYLWKEWREQRAILLGIVAAVPVLMAIAVLAIPGKKLEDPLFAVIVSLGCMLVGAIAIGTDLVAGENRRGSMHFLRRQPAGLRAPFLAKLLFYVAALIALAGYGLVAGCFTTGAVLPDSVHRMMLPEVWVLAVGALWLFAVSCWVPRGTLAPPAAALAGLIVAPAFLLHGTVPGWRLGDWNPGELVVLWGGGALLTAYLAFTVGYRHGGGPARALRWGLLGVVACSAPFYSHAVASTLGYHGHLGGVEQIAAVYLSPDGRSAFVHRYRKIRAETEPDWLRPLSPLMVDLETGDTRSARPAEGTRFRTSRARSTSWLALPDGRRLWVDRWQLKRDAAGGGAESVEGPWGHGSPRIEGLGVFFFNRGILDPSRDGRFFRQKKLGFALHCFRVRPGLWLLRAPRQPWKLFDPETGDVREARGLEKGVHLQVILDDGRLLAIRRDGPIEALDPETGAACEVVVEGWDGHGFRPFDPGPHPQAPARTPGGSRLFLLHDGENALIARFDADTDTLVPALATAGHRDVRLVACDDEESAHVVVDSSELWLVEFGSHVRAALLYPN
jgi:hypothetical protein